MKKDILGYVSGYWLLALSRLIVQTPIAILSSEEFYHFYSKDIVVLLLNHNISLINYILFYNYVTYEHHFFRVFSDRLTERHISTPYLQRLLIKYLY